MTEKELTALWDTWSGPVPVHVKANDYAYDGWLVGGCVKRSKARRALVEDDNGRLFIHNAGQLAVRS